MNNQYGRLMLDISGTILSDDDKVLIRNKHVGGLIFFSRNFESFYQIKDLVAEIRNIKEIGNLISKKKLLNIFLYREF